MFKFINRVLREIHSFIYQKENNENYKTLINNSNNQDELLNGQNNSLIKTPKDLLIEKVSYSGIFRKDKLQYIVQHLQELDYPHYLRTSPPLLTPDEKSNLNVKFKGKLSRVFYDALNPELEVKELILKYDNLIKEYSVIERQMQNKDRRESFAKIAQKNRATAIQLGFNNAVWKLASKECAPQCHHEHLDNKSFSLINGVYCKNTKLHEFPGETLGCICFYQLEQLGSNDLAYKPDFKRINDIEAEKVKQLIKQYYKSVSDAAIDEYTRTGNFADLTAYQLLAQSGFDLKPPNKDNIDEE